MSAVLFIAGCMQSGPWVPTAAVPLELPVVGGAVTVAGPRGYCVARREARDAAEGAFVVLSSCASISGNPDAPRPVTRALLTVSVSGDFGAAEAILKEEAALQSFFRSDAGRASLARDGTADSLSIVSAEREGDLFVIHAKDQAIDETPALAEDHWRALMDVNGWLVSASVVALSDRPLPNAEARSLLAEFVRKITEASSRPQSL